MQHNSEDHNYVLIQITSLESKPDIANFGYTNEMEGSRSSGHLLHAMLYKIIEGLLQLANTSSLGVGES